MFLDNIHKKKQIAHQSLSHERLFLCMLQTVFSVKKKTNVDITKKLKQQLVTFSNSQRAAISKAAPRSLIIWL